MAKKRASKRATTPAASAKRPAKKRATKGRPAKAAKQATASDGIDLGAVVEAIKPQLAGMTQREIAAAMDTTPMVVSHWMTGYRVPSLGVIERLATLAGGRLVVRFEAGKKRTKKSAN